MRTVEWVVPAPRVPETAPAAALVLDDWKVRAPLITLWFAAAAARLHADDEARLVLSYDATSGLLSFDVWVRDRRVYGIDDFLG